MRSWAASPATSPAPIPHDPEEMRRAIVLGSALASFVVEAFGTDRLLSLDSADLETRIAAFHDLSVIPEMNGALGAPSL